MVELPAAAFDAVVFDMDGVVTNTAGVHRRAWQDMFDRFLADVGARTGEPQAPFGVDDYLRYVDGKARDDGVRSFLASRGIDLPTGAADDGPENESVWGLANRKNEAFRRVLVTDGAAAFPSTVALVRSLQEHGVGTAVISASRNAQAVLEAAGVGGLFPVRVDGVDAARLDLPGKPDPAVFVEAARRLGAEPARTAVVEDAQAGVRAGHAGHFALVIGVDRSGQADELLAAGADVVVSDLEEVSVTP